MNIPPVGRPILEGAGLDRTAGAAAPPLGRANVPLEAFAGKSGALITSHVANVPDRCPERSNGMLYTLTNVLASYTRAARTVGSTSCANNRIELSTWAWGIPGHCTRQTK